MRNVFCTLLSVFLLASCGGAYAAEVKITDVENDIVTVSGENASGGNVFIAVLNPNHTASDISDNDYQATSAAVHTAVGGYMPSGKWSYDIKMLPDSAAGGGAYTFIITAPGGKETKTVNFYSSDYKKGLIEFVNDPGEDEIADRIDEIISKFGLSEHELFTKGNSADIAECLETLRDNFQSKKIPSDNAVMEDTLLRAMLISAFNCENDEALAGSDGYLKYISDILDLSDNDKYIDYCTSISSDGVNEINEILLSKEYSVPSELLEAFEENVLVRVITDYKQNGYGHVSEYFEKYEADYKNAGFKNLDKLTSTVSRYLASSDETTLDGLRKEYASLLSGEKKGTGGGSGGGSSSGNSSFGQGFVANPNVPKSSFSDIDGYDWAKEAIEGLYTLGVVNGKGNGVFAPADLLSRAELTKMIVCAFSLSGESTSDFSDISDHWAKEYIEIANALGIVNGVGEGMFAPNDLVTREQAAKIIYGALARINGGAESNESDTAFADDAAIADYAREAVYYMRSNGIISGKDGNLFAPKDNLTRAEAAKMVYGAIVHHKEK